MEARDFSRGRLHRLRNLLTDIDGDLVIKVRVTGEEAENTTTGEPVDYDFDDDFSISTEKQNNNI